MPGIIAIKDGDWSDPSVWHANRVPQPSDSVYSNGFTVDIDIDATVKTLTNEESYGTSAVPIMTNYTTPEGVVSASNQYDNINYQAFRAFDGTVKNSYNHWIGKAGRVLPEWLQYEFSSPKTIVAYSLQTTVYDNYRATDWEFQAWDGTNWITLDTNVGSPSQAFPYTRTINNTTAYSIYRIFITDSLSSAYLSIGELRLFEDVLDAQTSISGGGFVLNANVSLNCTEYIRGSEDPVLTWSGGSGTTSTVTTPFLSGSRNGYTFVVNGEGTLNLNIDVSSNPEASSNNNHLFEITASANINLIGSILSIDHRAGYSLHFKNTSSGAVFNMTGDIIQYPNEENPVRIEAPITYNQTGDLELSSGSYPFYILTSGCNIDITGSIVKINGGGLGIVTGQSCILRVVGPLVSQTNGITIYSVNYNSAHFFSGPFVHSDYGYVLLYVPRYNIIPSTTTYIEFPDSTTRGQLLPTPAAPRAQFISPAAASDSPDPADVRLGVSYSFSSVTGTLNVPHPNQVTYGVAVDDTFGNAVLTPESVWNYAVSNLAEPNSIGERLKNASTVESTGDQLQSFL